MDNETLAVVAAVIALVAIPPVIAYYRRQNVGFALLLAIMFWPAAMVMVLRRPDR